MPFHSIGDPSLVFLLVSADLDLFLSEAYPTTTLPPSFYRWIHLIQRSGSTGSSSPRLPLSPLTTPSVPPPWRYFLKATTFASLPFFCYERFRYLRPGRLLRAIFSQWRPVPPRFPSVPQSFAESFFFFSSRADSLSPEMCLFLARTSLLILPAARPLPLCCCFFAGFCLHYLSWANP